MKANAIAATIADVRRIGRELLVDIRNFNARWGPSQLLPRLA